MRAYFLDKMQFVLSRPEVMKMLEKVNGCEEAVSNIR